MEIDLVNVLLDDIKNIEINDVVENANNNETNFQKLFIAIEAIYLSLIVLLLKIEEIFWATLPTFTSTSPLISSIAFLRTEIIVIKKINKLMATSGIKIVKSNVNQLNGIVLFSSVQ